MFLLKSSGNCMFFDSFKGNRRSLIEVKFDNDPLKSAKALPTLAKSWNFGSHLNDFKPYKMVKLSQTIRRQFVDELSECVSPFCGIGT